MEEKITPMMQQYQEIKERHTDAVLFYRLGDFYEMFGDDALLCSRELDITLTTRDKNKDENARVPMCGVPYHASEAYIARLIEKGHKVAVCEQMEDPRDVKGIVKRDVVRILTPGTLMESSMLQVDKSAYLASVSKSANRMAACFVDISTGELVATTFEGEDSNHITNELGRFSPAEVILDYNTATDPIVMQYFQQNPGCLYHTGDEQAILENAAPRIKKQFDKSLEVLGIAQFPELVSALGALLGYLDLTQKRNLSHINRLHYYESGEFMEIDLHTRRNLELSESLNNREKRGSLLWLLDKTKTPLGARLLRTYVAKPLLNPVKIQKRLDGVAELAKDTVTRKEVMLYLQEVGDLERLIGKVVYGNASARDLRTMHLSLSVLPSLKAQISGKQSALLKELAALDPMEDMISCIDAAIVEEPPFSIREGGMIRDGYNEEVDHLRYLLKDSTGALRRMEQQEQKNSGIKKLKIGYNKNFGYYIEIPRALSEVVPEGYIRKQTLVDRERFITQELKELEVTLDTAKQSLEEKEFDLFEQLRKTIAQEVVRFQKTALQVAQLDVCSGLAEVAVRNNYVMPEIDNDTVIELKDARHPVVEAMQKDSLFVANDVFLDNRENMALLITGPNMAGKSTYMRQTALIVLMAQMGSFVPAKYARIGLVDRVFTRIGASDDLSAGKSTFMVEMTEVAEILKYASKRSLLILDEIGRGTSTYDGMSIARAVLEFVANKKQLGAKVLFATHYHELTVLEEEMPGIKNFHIAAKKRDDDIIFLRKIVPGGADESYGIEVAKLAGVPNTVIRRAKEVLEMLETEDGGKQKSSQVKSTQGQVHMQDFGQNLLVERLQTVDLNTLTPLEAMNILYELKKTLT